MEEILDNIQELIDKGRYFEARQMAEEVPPSNRIIQLMALAASKSGTPKEGESILAPLYQREPENPETSGILAGIYKEIFRREQDPHYGKLAYETYLKNFKLTKSYYTGINAAAMSKILGKTTEARKIAEIILNRLSEKEVDFWEKATLAECRLLMKDYANSIKDFIEVRQDIGKDWGKINTIRNQIWLLQHYMYVPEEIINLFQPPVIVAFIGHMIDAPDRESVRFSNEMAGPVKSAIKAAIQTYSIEIGYCSLACGADILFAEAMLEAGKEVKIIVPFQRQEFLEISVRVGGDDWVERYYQIEKQVKIHYLTEEAYRLDDNFFPYLGKIIFGASILRSQKLSSDPHLLTVLSNYDLNHATGGTRHMINEWPYREKVFKINIDDFRTGAKPEEREEFLPRINNSEMPHRKIYYILTVQIIDSFGVMEEQLLHVHPEIMERFEVIFKQFQLNNNITAFFFDSPVLITDLATTILTFYKNHEDYDVKVGLNVGPVTFNPTHPGSKIRRPTGKSIETSVEICNSIQTNTIVCTADFISHLILESKQYEYQNSGFIINKEEKIETYRLLEDER